jgi:hypothetical protein
MQATPTKTTPLGQQRPAQSKVLAAICLACGILTTAAPAATDKSGIIDDETWTKAMSPIRVVGDITVANLTIQPGVEVLFTGNFTFDCLGIFKAQGDAANKIWFHGDTGVTWKGLNFLNNPTGRTMTYCIVENSNDHGIEITNSHVAISHCEIKNNMADVSGGGVYIDLSNSGIPVSSIADCQLTDNSGGTRGGGLYVEISGSATSIPEIVDCVIEHNSAGVGGGAEIKLNISTAMVLRRCLISRNTATNGAGGGVTAWTDSVVPASFRLVDCSIIDNIVQGSFQSGSVRNTCGAGLYTEDSVQCDLLRCIVRGNQAIASGSNYEYAYGAGLFIWEGMLSARNCTIENNAVQSGISAYGGGIYSENGNVSLYNCCVRNNTLQAPNTGSGGMRVGQATVHVENCSILSNTSEAIKNGDGLLTVINSIIFFNNSNGTQVTRDGAGSTNITYSNVQNGYTGTGNINQIPLFRPDGTVPSPWPWPTPVPSSWPWPSRLNNGSPGIDEGVPTATFNDLCFYNATTTPWGSLGTARNDMGAYGGPGACLWEPGSEQIKVLAPIGGGLFGVGDNVTLTVQASGIGPFTYVWKKGGEVITDIPGHITGANGAALTVTGATAEDAGNYTVEVTNALGDKVTSSAAAVAIDPLRANVKMFAGVIIQAAVGKTVKVEYSNDLSSGSWTTLTQLVLPTSPYTYYDTDSPNHPQRFYRAVEVP